MQITFVRYIHSEKKSLEKNSGSIAWGFVFKDTFSLNKNSNQYQNQIEYFAEKFILLTKKLSPSSITFIMEFGKDERSELHFYDLENKTFATYLHFKKHLKECLS